MEKNKVSEIEFHIVQNEIEDFIIRSAELIKEGYSLYSVECDSLTIGCPVVIEPYIHIKFTKNKWE